MYKIIILLILLSLSIVSAQSYVETAKLQSEFALKENREEFRRETLNSIKYAYPVKDKKLEDEKLQDAFQNAVLVYFKSDSLKEAIRFVVNNFSSYSESTVYSALEAAYTLYPNEFHEEIDELANKTYKPNLFAIAVNYLLADKEESPKTQRFLDLMNKKEFDINYRSKELLRQLRLDLIARTTVDTTEMPSVKDLLAHHFQKGKTIIYSIFRKERDYPGITVIKKPGGNFVRNDSGEIFHIKHLARSLSDLPYYLKNGNTPQGIYSVVGFYLSPTESIGPTPNVLTRIPYEVPPSIFYHDTTFGRRWNLSDYLNLIPESWKDYQPLQNAYHGGKIGRRKIVMHGSVDDLSFYKDKPFYPLTPTRGCIVSKEIWDEETGKNIESDQAKLMNAFFSTGELDGFLVVLEINDKKKPVNIEEIKPYILDAEK